MNIMSQSACWLEKKMAHSAGLAKEFKQGLLLEVWAVLRDTTKYWWCSQGLATAESCYYHRSGKAREVSGITRDSGSWNHGERPLSSSCGWKVTWPLLEPHSVVGSSFHIFFPPSHYQEQCFSWQFPGESHRIREYRAFGPWRSSF